MDRREFIRGVGASIVAGSSIGFGKISPLGNAPAAASSFAYDLVAVKGGEPDVMFDRAIESLGGMNKFVVKGQTVVVKPNIGWDVIPDKGANTNPKLLSRIIGHCLDAGAKDVFVFDHTCDNWVKCYKNSGLEAAAKSAGAKVVSGDTEGYYQEIEIPRGVLLKKAKVHELILSSDVFINVPVLKVHDGSRVTVAMKNLMGAVWDRRYWHRNGLHQCIADFATYCKPALNVVDAYTVMNSNGPRGVSIDDVSVMKSLLIARDMVAVDAASAKLLGVDPETVGHIRIANEMKAGTMDLSKLSINRIRI